MTNEFNSTQEQASPANISEINPGWLHKWAVVQDSRPFGYWIQTTRPSKHLAELAVHGNRYFSVVLTQEAEAYNQRVTEDKDFLHSEIEAYHKSRRELGDI